MFVYLVMWTVFRFEVIATSVMGYFRGRVKVEIEIVQCYCFVKVSGIGGSLVRRRILDTWIR